MRKAEGRSSGPGGDPPGKDRGRELGTDGVRRQSLGRRIGRGLLLALVAYALVSYVSARVRWVESRQGGGPLASSPTVPANRLAGVIHVHTHRSHDSEGRDDEVAAAAVRTGLDFVLITDHRSEDGPADEWAERARRLDGVLLVRGQEMRISGVGYVLVTRMDTVVTRWEGGLGSFAERVRRDGSLAIVAHPRSPLGRELWQPDSVPAIGAWEAFDIVDMARRRLASPWVLYHVGSLLASFPLGLGDRSVMRLSREGFETPGAAALDSLQARAPVTAVGGLDMHPKGRFRGALLPGYDPFFRTLVNHVDPSGPLPEDPEEAAEALAEAIRAGRVFVTFREAAAARSFTYRVRSPDGGTAARPAGQTPHLPGLTLEASVTDPPGRVLWRVVRDGETAAWVRGAALEWPLQGPGAYRVEAYLYAVRLGAFVWDPRPWIYTNPIRVLP